MSKRLTDTNPKAEEFQISLIRRASVAERLSRTRSLSRTVIQLSRRAIARANPGLSEQERDISRITNDTVLVREGKDITSGRFADSFSDLPNRTLQEIPALKHYRLIHESVDNASVQIFPESGITTLPDIKYVKIFEYVKGAHISGEGIIEVPIVTNTGRTFVYRQASENGEFIVPYSTTKSHYEVNATGQYHIAGTSRYITVTENDVKDGNRIAY